jgi:hypothetical protein
MCPDVPILLSNADSPTDELLIKEIFSSKPQQVIINNVSNNVRSEQNDKGSECSCCLQC